MALESTIISHGMPYPQNVETAKEVEKHYKRKMVLFPATIAILGGPPESRTFSLKNWTISGRPVRM